MRNYNLLQLIGILIFTAISSAVIGADNERLYLKYGTVIVEDQSLEEINIQIQQSAFGIVTFDVLPDSDQKKSLSDLGIHLLDYLPKNSFYVHVIQNITQETISEYKIKALNPVLPEYKLHPRLNGKRPEHIYLENGRINVVVFLHQGFLIEGIKAMEALKFDIVKADEQGHFVNIILPEDELSSLSQIEEVYFIRPIGPEPRPDNYPGAAQHRSSMINQEFKGGLKYDGTGVKVAMQDDGAIGPHIDHQGRTIDLSSGNFGSETHGDHVSGTIFGAGNLDPDGRGMAPGAELYVYTYSLWNSPPFLYFDPVPSNHYDRYGIRITSTSFSAGEGGDYDQWANKLDNQSRAQEGLIHIFSAGNDGTDDHNFGYGPGWNNITGGHKAGKNVIAVANLNAQGEVRNSSSRGPCLDGRIKPDVAGKGTSVWSTMPNNEYDFRTGTSMSCPGVAGSMAQLYHAYKELNNQQNPTSDLMKAVMLNGADDIDNIGPDFKTGWGRINLRKSLEIIEKKQYIKSSINTGSNQHTVSVPQGVEQVKIMLYWHDYPGTTSSSADLQNNLDLTISDQQNNTHYPLVLDYRKNPATLDAPAQPGIDSVNNMEQVVIDQPSAGNLTVNVNATTVPFGPQNYVIVYEFIKSDIHLVYPNGGEGIEYRDVIDIHWDTYGDTGTFKIEFSSDGGGSWSTLASNVNGAERRYSWVAGNSLTDKARIKISRGNQVDSSEHNFTVFYRPENIVTEWVCEDSMKISWDEISFTDSYRVYMLGEKYMDSVGTSSENSFVFHGTDANKRYWVSASCNPTNPGATGKRALGYQTFSGPMNCPVTSVVELSEEDDRLMLYPNPANEMVLVTYPSHLGGRINFSVTGMDGKIFMESSFDSSENRSMELNVGSLKSGTYLVQFSDGQNLITEKLSVQ